MMRRHFPIVLFLLLMACDVGSFLLQKFASDRAIDAQEGYLRSVVLHPWAWLALAIAPLQLWIWTRILAKADISLAFPLTSLGVPLTMIAAAICFGEKPDRTVWVGAGLITVGAIILQPKRNAAANKHS